MCIRDSLRIGAPQRIKMLADDCGRIACLGQRHPDPHPGGQRALLARHPAIPFLGLGVIAALFLNPAQLKIGVGQPDIALDPVSYTHLDVYKRQD